MTANAGEMLRDESVWATSPLLMEEKTLRSDGAVEACKYKDDCRTAIKINENELQLRVLTV